MTSSDDPLLVTSMDFVLGSNPASVYTILPPTYSSVLFCALYKYYLFDLKKDGVSDSSVIYFTGNCNNSPSCLTLDLQNNNTDALITFYIKTDIEGSFTHTSALISI